MIFVLGIVICCPSLSLLQPFAAKPNLTGDSKVVGIRNSSLASKRHLGILRMLFGFVNADFVHQPVIAERNIQGVFGPRWNCCRLEMSGHDVRLLRIRKEPIKKHIPIRDVRWCAAFVENDDFHRKSIIRFSDFYSSYPNSGAKLQYQGLRGDSGLFLSSFGLPLDLFERHSSDYDTAYTHSYQGKVSSIGYPVGDSASSGYPKGLPTSMLFIVEIGLEYLAVDLLWDSNGSSRIGWLLAVLRLLGWSGGILNAFFVRPSRPLRVQ